MTLGTRSEVVYIPHQQRIDNDYYTVQPGYSSIIHGVACVNLTASRHVIGGSCFFSTYGEKDPTGDANIRSRRGEEAFGSWESRRL